MKRRFAEGKPVPIVLGLAAVAAALAAATGERRQLTEAVRRLGLGAATLSLACGLGSIFVLVFLWREVLRGLGGHPPFRVTAHVFFIGQLGKYLPGSIWPVVTQMELGRRENIPRRTMVAANLITLALSLTIGMALAIVLLPLASPAPISRFGWAFLLLPPLLLCLHPRVIPAVLNWLLKRLGREPINQTLAPRNIAIACCWAALSWLLLGLHVYVITHTLGAHGPRSIATAIGGSAFAVGVGIAVIPAPAGAGIRDAVLVLALAPSIGTANALAAALASRVILILGDLIMAAVFAASRSNQGKLRPPP